MSYVALYRKFRPQTFDQIRGQGHVVKAFKNQLINNRIGHAYLFTGTRGTGKTSAAKIFAKAVNCLNPVNGEPCNECENCMSVAAGNFVDVVEVDAASNNGVDDIRRIIEEIRYTPVKGKYKVFIIDEAHMITGPAFNAFLKTLEEPPAYAVFILATTEPHKLPITILSRCQRYDFRRITTEQIAENLADIAGQEGVEAEAKALSYIARVGDGSMRDSISLLDKCIAFNLGTGLTYENVLDTLGTVDTVEFSGLFRSVYSGNAADALKVIDRAVCEGRDLTQFATDLIWYMRNILMVKAAGEKSAELLGLSAENLAQLFEDSKIAESNTLMRYIRVLSELLNQIRLSSAKQVLLEVGIIKLACPQMETDTSSLADRIRQLESRPAYNVSSNPGYSSSQNRMAGMQQTAAAQTAAEPAAVHKINNAEYASAIQQNSARNNRPEPEQQTAAVQSESRGEPGPGFGEYMDDDEFFGGLASTPRMTDPDAFADLFGDDIAITYEGSGGYEETQNDVFPQFGYDQPPAEGNFGFEAAPKVPAMQNEVQQLQAKQGQAEEMHQPALNNLSSTGNLVGIWPQVLDSCESRILKTTLNKCSVSQAGDNILVLETTGTIALKNLKDEQNLAYIRDLASRAAGRAVDVSVVMAGSSQSLQAGKAAFPEELLNNINFEIGTEER